jgi:hypothetical protein
MEPTATEAASPATVETAMRLGNGLAGGAEHNGKHTTAAARASVRLFNCREAVSLGPCIDQLL